jgi:hypothetical protein
MNDEWRLQIDVEDESHLESLVERLDAQEAEDELSDAFEDRVIVSRDGSRVFAYAATREQAEAAQRLVAGLASEHGWAVATDLKHWHPLAEHAELIAAEREEAAAQGAPGFEVRVDLPSHHEARRFAEQLRAEGLPAVRRWKYLVVGADDEDGARQLAERLRAEAPSGSEVRAEGSGQVAWAERPANPFAIFGGLGG